MTPRPDFDIDFAEGRHHEDQVKAFFEMDASLVEVKASRAGLGRNVFIEVRQNPRNSLAGTPHWLWPESGWVTTKATHGVFRCSTTGAMVVLPVANIQAAIRKRIFSEEPYDVGGKHGDNPTVGWWVPVSELLAPWTSDPRYGP